MAQEKNSTATEDHKAYLHRTLDNDPNWEIQCWNCGKRSTGRLSTFTKCPHCNADLLKRG
jgi:Zn finger protein HypA/HybF involved in hydrogenase expression